MSWLSRAFGAPPPPYQPPETRDWSISSPEVFGLLGAVPGLSGVAVNETTAMGLSGVAGCVQLISGIIADLPLRTVKTNDDGSTVRTSSWLDDPAGLNGPTPYEFIEMVVCNLALHGNHYSLKIRGGAGQLLWLQPLPPQSVSIEVKNGQKVYRVQLDNGKSRELTDREILHIPYLSLDGVRGMSQITNARIALGTAIAGERSAARLYKSGLLASAIVTPTEQLSPDEAQIVRDTLDRMLAGEVNAGAIAVLNKALNVEKWSINPADAQFLESRRFTTSEIARFFNVPPHLIGDVERSTSWGEGINQQTLAFQRYTLRRYTSRIEARLTRLLNETPSNRKAEFDFRGLLAGSPSEEIELLIKQKEAGLLTDDEVRAKLNMPPLPKPEKTPEEDNADEQ